MVSDVATVLATHGAFWRINSKERWSDCICDARVPWFDHEDIDDHEGSHRAHLAAVLEAEVIRPREREAWRLGYRAGELDGTYRLAVSCGYRASAPLADNPFTDEGGEDR